MISSEQRKVDAYIEKDWTQWKTTWSYKLTMTGIAVFAIYGFFMFLKAI